MPTVAEILQQTGPSLSSVVQAVLVQAGLTAVAARQRISRAPLPVKRLPMHFPHRETFLFLEDDEGSERFWTNLLAAFDNTNSAFGFAVGGLDGRGGVVPVSQFGIVSGSPHRLKNQIAFEQILKRGEAFGLFRTEEVPGLGPCVVFGAGLERAPLESSAAQSRIVAEDICLEAIRNWSRRMGLASWEKIQVRKKGLAADAQPRFGQFFWDLVGPSYVFPLRTYDARERNSKPGFLVADILLGRGPIGPEHVRPFLHKVALMRAQKTARPFLAMMVADHFAPSAYGLRGKAGVLLVRPEDLFGEDVATALTLLIRTLTNASAAVLNNPEVVPELIGKLSKIEGAAGNLRGPLFEMTVAHLVLLREGNAIEVGKQILAPFGKRAEVDVLRIKGNEEVAVYECKGQLADGIIEEKDVENWLSDRIPTIRNWLNASGRNSARHVFEYWTTGRFSTDAHRLLLKAQQATKKYRIAFRDGDAVLEYAKAAKAPSFVKVLNEHYLKHPLSTHAAQGDETDAPAAVG